MLKSPRISVFAFSLTLTLVGSAAAKCPVGDFNGDCKVTVEDLQILAEQWLDPSGGSADLTGDDDIIMLDFAVLAENWQRTGIPLAINEVMASNSSTIQDGQGEYDDWIELYNYGDDAIDVGGMYLTDDLADPTMWRIPANDPSATTIPAHGYLLIWADSDVSDPGLHANFRLSALGDTVGLFAADGSTLIDSVIFGDQKPDISYGRCPDANESLRFMAFPTPKTPNVSSVAGFVGDTRFSHDRGFYDQPFSVTISTETDDAVIYYTLDGSCPYDLQRGVPNGLVYMGPVPITTTTCLRAFAFKPGWKPSNVDTHTYVFLDDVIRQPVRPPGFPTNWGHTYQGDYEMDPEVVNAPSYRDTIKDDLKAVPTLSLVMNRDDWFGSGGQGIYIQGERNERACSAELILPDGTQGFQIDCAVMIVGGTSPDRWKMDKLSMRLKFKGEYGLAKLRFPVFGDEAVTEFDTLAVDARMNNSWAYGGGVSPDQQRRKAQYTRDQFVSDIQNAMGGYGTHGRHVHLYLNGLYWGLYWLHERPDEHFAAAYFGGDDEDYDVLKHNSGTVVSGYRTNYNEMFNVANAGLASDAQYEIIQQYLDVLNFIDYMITNFYVGNWDWAHQNWYASRSRVDANSRWRYHSWDAEHVMEALYEDNTGKNDGGGPTGLHRRLAQNAEYRMLFADHVHRHFFNNGLLTPAGAAALYQVRLEEVDRAVVGESARWGDNHSSTPYTRDVDWVRERDWLLNVYFPQRTEIVLNQFKSRDWYPNVVAPVFHINGSYQHGGRISSHDVLSIAATTGVIYYTIDGSDPRQPQEPQPGTIPVREDAAKRVLVPSGPVSDNWKGGGAFDDSAWISGTGGVGFEASTGYEALIDIDLREQMYTRNATCYIRIPFTFATGQAQFDSLTLRVRYDDGFIAYLNGSEVARRNFTGEPAWDSRASASHADSAAVVFEDIDISDYRDALRNGANILAVHGMNSSATGPDFLIDVELRASQPGSGGETLPGATKYTGPITLSQTTQVKARVLSGSTWSTLNEAIFAIGPVAESLRITEIMYHPPDTNEPNDPNEEFIELKNIGSQTINLNLVRFTNGVNFTFPSLELAGGQYVLVVKDQAAFSSQYPDFSGVIAGQFSGSLANDGERIRLEDAIGQTILDFKYSDNWRDITDGDGFSLTIVNAASPDPNSWGEKDSWRASAFYGGSPGWDDTGIIPEPGSVVINEVLAHSHAEAADWIELYNTTGEAINIGGWFLSDDGDDLTKYEIADDTVIAANEYLVLYEDQNFGNPSDPNCHRVFALSENGDQVYLSSAQDGVLTGYQEMEDFGASATGVSFGRYYKGSTDNYNFVAMSQNTPGSANAYPQVGPIVINEIMYNPGSGNQNEEYIELYNITAQPVSLYDYMTNEPWKFTDAIEYTFPSDPVVTMPAGGYLLVVKDLDAFAARYGAMPAGAVVLGPYEGQLKNGGEKLELSMPGDVDRLGWRYYIRVDRVNFSDGSHPEDQPGGVDSWPVAADGGGLSLSRKVPGAYGNDVANWQAATPSPGSPNP
jgi:hypothetical protein